MLKKYASILLMGSALVACDNTVPLGGQGYFDPPAPQAEQAAQDGPINLVPDTPEAPQGDTTATLNAAIDGAQDGTQTPADGTQTPTDTSGISTDDGSLNLNAETFAEQEAKRNAAAALLAEARAKYTIIEPGTLPKIVAGVNIAEYARSTTNKVGEKLYRRPVIKDRFSRAECRKFSTPDDAQRYFLANGGPEKDPLNLDPDGDGFACSWSPEPFRMLR